MEIFFLRHFESIKNTQVTFSSLDDKEELTENGIIKGKLVAMDIKEFVSCKKLRVENIYCADSVRAKHSAQLIAEMFKDVNVLTYKSLLSTKSYDLLGHTKEYVRKTNPQFIKELELYDAGLFSSYNFHRQVNREMKQKYEIDVIETINDILTDEKETLKIIVMHNSSITAALINYARKICGYPTNYYGKVTADNGGIFWLSKNKEQIEFKRANCQSNSLLDIDLEGSA